MNRLLAITSSCLVAAACCATEAPARKAEISTVDEQYLCQDGSIKIRFTIVNASTGPVPELRDLLPWSDSEGGAGLKLVAGDGETTIFEPRRRPVDPHDIVVLPPGESSGILDVDKLLPDHDRLVTERGNLLVQWDYVYGPPGDSRRTTKALMLRKDGIDRCYSGQLR